MATVDQNADSTSRQAVEAPRVQVEVIQPALGDLGARGEFDELGKLPVGRLALDGLFRNSRYRRRRFYDQLSLL